MSFKIPGSRLPGLFLSILLAIVSFRCDESLPVTVYPTNVLSIQITKVEQLPDRVAIPGKQIVHIQLTGENTFDDVFQDTADITGSMMIWWQRLPQFYSTIPLNLKDLNERNLIQGNKLTLLPGQKFTMDIYWNLHADNGIYRSEE